MLYIELTKYNPGFSGSRVSTLRMKKRHHIITGSKVCSYCNECNHSWLTGDKTLSDVKCPVERDCF